MCMFHKWEKYIPYFSCSFKREYYCNGSLDRYNYTLWRTEKCSKCGKIKKIKSDEIVCYGLDLAMSLEKKLKDKNILTEEDFKIQKLKDSK